MSVKEMVAALLRSPPVVRMNFRWGRSVLRGVDYTALADDIERGAVRVVIDPAMDDLGAKYSYHNGGGRPNTLVFPTTWQVMGPSAAWRTMGVIHECTHAIQDKAQLPLPMLDAEGAAYVAEAVYAKLARITHPLSRPPTLIDRARHLLHMDPMVPLAREILRCAEAAAEAIVRAGGTGSVPIQLEAALRRAIAAHPAYRGEGVYGFDGMGSSQSRSDPSTG